ncbi:oxidoreductase OpS5-like [Penaeus japonicus]|uniref:oxidoreductase OpS5-like n=1 Tax=Penaeus japonicus TaxID=27405 RepID=UPI001C711152|nr:oxidoreductase OpS5-like [Penaeus japonicus]
MKLSRFFLVFGVVSSISGEKHECERQCVAGDTRTCKYDFTIIEYHTLSRACYDCPNTLSDCGREECIVADGVSRPLLSVNRQLPGPAIQVCEGDRVVVDVHNTQFSDTETIHWHGQHMRSHQYYDGVPFVTQCPIMGSFRYDFPAATPGTHWWHSHTGVHRGDGLFGAFVVRQPEDGLHGAYDVDDHVLILHDWFHGSTNSEFLGYQHSTSMGVANTILMNGKGRNLHAQEEGLEAVATPLEVVRVTPGLRHRLRLVSASSFVCPMIVSVDGHQLTVIAIDGAEVIPRTVDSLEILSGERVDLVLEANQPVDNYWIRIVGIAECSTKQCMQGAVLRYEGAPDSDPSGNLEYNPFPPGAVLNPVFPWLSDEVVNIVDLDALAPSVLPEEVDQQFHILFSMNAVNNSFFFNQELYPFNGVPLEWQRESPQVNDLTFEFPQAPPLSQPHADMPKLCRYGQNVSSFCEGDFCRCTYVLEVALGSTVEMVLVSEGIHPFHLHGYNFHVVAMGVIGVGTTVQDVIDLDAAGGITRKLQDAPLKDTVMVPNGGYTIIRFTADNPGWWIMHCHFMYHSEMGMAALLHVGGEEDLPPVPQGFPSCGPFMPEV